MPRATNNLPVRSSIAILLAFLLQVAAPALLTAPAADAHAGAPTACCPLCDCGDVCPCAAAPTDNAPPLPEAPLPQRPTDPTQLFSVRPARVTIVACPQPGVPQITAAQRTLAIAGDPHTILPLLCVWRT